MSITADPTIAESTSDKIPAADLPTLEQALRKWCNSSIAIGMCYTAWGTIKDGLPIAFSDTPESMEEARKRPGELVYQDGTNCSASSAFADVYRLDDGSYTVYADWRAANFTGDEGHSFGQKVHHCPTLAAVIDVLVSGSFHDPNTVGQLLLVRREVNKWRGIPICKMTPNMGQHPIPVLALCAEESGVIRYINDAPSMPWNRNQ